MFFFSMHPNTDEIGNHSKYSKGWSVKMLNSIYALGENCLSHLNSPIVWAYGIRRQDNFVYSDFIVIDVDDDSKMSLDQAIDHYGRFVHLIGTTKSHGLLKGNKVSERYRIFVLVERRIFSALDYRNLCLQEAIRCGGDQQAGGLAMHFMPIKRVVSYSEVGRKLPYEISLKPNQREVKRHSGPIYGIEKKIPPYIQCWLDGDVGYGQRNLTAFKAACGLKKRNFSEDEIVEIILSSSLPLDRSEKVQTEIKATVRSAMRRK